MFPWPFRLRSPLFLPFIGLACGEACCYYAVLGISEGTGTGGWEALATWSRWSWILVGAGAGVVAISGMLRWRNGGLVGLMLACGGLGIAAISPSVRLSLPLRTEDQGARHWTCVVESAAVHRFGGFAAQAVCRTEGAAASDGLTTRVEFLLDEAPVPGAAYRGWGRWQPWREDAAFNEKDYRNALGFSGKLTWLAPPVRGPGPSPSLLHRTQRAVSDHFAGVRERLRGILEQRGTEASRGLLWGLATGDKSLLTAEAKRQFGVVGLSHVLAVSGYHVGLVGIIAFALARSRWTGLRWLAAPGLLGVWWYVGLCGFPVSAVRAALMASFFVLGCWMRRPVPGLQMWSLAGWCVAWWMPLAAVQIGAQLSFLAVLGIFLGLEVARSLPRHRFRRVGQATVVPLSAQGATSPLTAVAFGSFPSYFLPVNLLAGPWVTAIGYGLGAGCMLALWGPEVEAWTSWIWWGVNGLADALVHSVTWASTLPGAAWSLEGWTGASGWALGTCLGLGALGRIRRKTPAATILFAGSALALAALPWTWQSAQPEPSAPVRWALVRNGTPALLWMEGDEVIPLVADSAGWERMKRWQRDRGEDVQERNSGPAPLGKNGSAGAIALKERYWVGWLPGGFWSLEWDRKGLGKWTIYPTSNEVAPRWTPWVAWHETLDAGAPWHLVDAQELADHLVHVALPLGDVGDGQDGIHPVVAPGIDGLHVESPQLENAQDVSIFDDSLGQTHPMIPHIVRLLVERKPVECLQIHVLR